MEKKGIWKFNMKKLLSALSLMILVSSIAAAISAQGVLRSNPSSPTEAVTARKFAMKIMGANVQEIREKVKAGNIKEIGSNAGSIAALAIFMPTVYKEGYRDVYPVKGSKYFYKAEMRDVATPYEDLRVQAEKLMELAAIADKSGVEAQLPRLLSACGSCHKQNRGEY